ncbi:hypothetical protein [Caulobacter hibisci]|uniref:Uncharacterized protein n=1 Tax=Caulobacter hibisci TaxID=2035993 RepID=A0ABS0SS16_9CAUL|nr:hypothetical protein [Caulobacter hibisci]MBI1682353.1 hypothetical protein [Caulobacter hibisci]
MSRALSVEEVKALTHQLVASVGGVVPAGIMLGVSHQRVSQYQNANHPDVMPFMAILTLQAAAQTDIVTGAASRAIKEDPESDILSAMVETMNRATQALAATHEMEADGHRDVGEIHEVRAAFAALKQQVDRAHDVANGLTPTRHLRAVG